MQKKASRKSLADQFVENTAKVRGLGLDDPIEWNAFGTSPQGAVDLMPAVGWGVAPSASAGAGQIPSRGNFINDAMLKLFMLGFNEKEFQPKRK